MQNFVRKWRELAPFIFRATATAPFFFTLAPPRRAPPFSVRASGAQALKVALLQTGYILRLSKFAKTDLLSNTYTGTM